MKPKVWGNEPTPDTPTTRAYPPDVNRDSSSRLPPVKRDDLDAAGQRAYDAMTKEGSKLRASLRVERIHVDALGNTRFVADQPTQPVFPSSPVTPWFIRVTVPGVLPSAAALASLATGAGLPVERSIDHGGAHSRWLLVGPLGRRAVDAAITRLADTHRIAAVAFRRV